MLVFVTGSHHMVPDELVLLYSLLIAVVYLPILLPLFLSSSLQKGDPERLLWLRFIYLISSVEMFLDTGLSRIGFSPITSMLSLFAFIAVQVCVFCQYFDIFSGNQ